MNDTIKEIQNTIEMVDSLILKLKNNIKISSKYIFIIKKILKKYIESYVLFLKMKNRTYNNEINDEFLKNFIYDEGDINNTINFLENVKSVLNKILFEIEQV